MTHLNSSSPNSDLSDEVSLRVCLSVCLSVTLCVVQIYSVYRRSIVGLLFTFTLTWKSSMQKCLLSTFWHFFCLSLKLIMQHFTVI